MARAKDNAMLNIKLDPKTERQVVDLAERNGVPLEDYLRALVERALEDMEDVADAEAVLRDYDPATNIAFNDVKRRFGLAN